VCLCVQTAVWSTSQSVGSDDGKRDDDAPVGCGEEKDKMTIAAKVVGPQDGNAGFLGSIGVRFMIDGGETRGGFSLVEHPMSPRALAAPLHRHSHEDEYSYVLEGRIGALLGDEVVAANRGDLIFKPRNQWHTFWNAGDTPARILEIISPAGFERFFAELVDLGGVARAEPQILSDLCARFGLEMDPGSVPGLVERFDLRFPGQPI
jgi:quercetin dioxygenase-like cupin family protein